MHRATLHAPSADWPRSEAADAVTLDFDARHRRRIRLTTDGGAPVLLDLPKAVAMADGDGLQLDDGRWLIVHAAAEPLMEVRTDNPLLRLRVAWHLGNRHLPTELRRDGDREVMRIRPDHVIADMVRGLGAEIVEVTAPFQPEGGAYGGHSHGGHHHHHDHGGHGHAH